MHTQVGFWKYGVQDGSFACKTTITTDNKGFIMSLEIGFDKLRKFVKYMVLTRSWSRIDSEMKETFLKTLRVFKNADNDFQGCVDRDGTINDTRIVFIDKNDDVTCLISDLSASFYFLEKNSNSILHSIDLKNLIFSEVDEDVELEYDCSNSTCKPIGFVGATKIRKVYIPSKGVEQNAFLFTKDDSSDEIKFIDFPDDEPLIMSITSDPSSQDIIVHYSDGTSRTFGICGSNDCLKVSDLSFNVKRTSSYSGRSITFKYYTESHRKTPVDQTEPSDQNRALTANKTSCFSPKFVTVTFIIGFICAVFLIVILVACVKLCCKGRSSESYKPTENQETNNEYN